MSDKVLRLTKGDELTWNNHDPSGDDRRWRMTQFAKLPFEFHRPIAKQYNYRFRKTGRTQANTFLRRFVSKFDVRTQRLATDPIYLKQYVRNRKHELTVIATNSPTDQDAYTRLSRRIESLGLKAPTIAGSVTVLGANRRMLDEGWLARQFRKVYLPKFEATAIQAGMVHSRAGLYVSDASLSAFRDRQSHNRQVLERIELENEIGQTFDLSDLVARSVANPTNRRHELMVRLYGFDEIAKQLDHVGLFITITCPSRMHARYWTSGDPVSSYDGTTPRQAQAYLNDIWMNTRARFKNANTHLYGFRMAEPQHDGTPHWHILLYTNPANQHFVCSTFQELSLRDSPDEKGANEQRCKIEVIDRSKGSGVAYAAKYVSKNIDGEHVDKDLHGKSAKDSAQRVVAWASIHRIRQFQQFGGPSVTCWRELRRLSAAPEGILDEARRAADQGDWMTFTNVLGGTDTCRKSHPVKLIREFNSNEGKYGEPIGYQITGLSDGVTCIQTHMHTWKVKLKSESLRVLDGVRHT